MMARLQIDGFASSMTRPRVVVVGDACVATGFARVLHSILDRLNARYEFHHLGVNYRGDPHDSPWKIYPAFLNGDHFGINRLGELIEKIHPQLVFMLADPWVIMKHAGVLASYKDRLRSIAYFPIDSGPVEPLAIVPLLENVDCLATYTRYAGDELETAIAHAKRTHPNLPTRDIRIVAHGVDTHQFHPIRGGRRAAREILFPGRTELCDAFIVLNANRNQPRKRIDLTMEAFAIFSRGKPTSVKLYLHMARQDTGWDIQLLARRLGIADRLLVTNDDNNQPAMSTERLNLTYNACDIGLNTACAEGWGLVSFEHAATRAAQVVPRHTALTELWEGAAEMVTPRFALTTERTLTNGYYLAPEDVAASLERLYADPAYRSRMADAALAKTQQPCYDWDTLAMKWDGLFSALLWPGIGSTHETTSRPADCAV